MVEVTVIDSEGGNLRTLVARQQEAGRYMLEFNAEDLPSGVYFLRLHAGDVYRTRKMLLIR
jgi:5-hydroxyisourate hydrolase-like protein (transthyretin family)